MIVLNHKSLDLKEWKDKTITLINSIKCSVCKMKPVTFNVYYINIPGNGAGRRIVVIFVNVPGITPGSL